jgi:hypothetical protein
MVPPRLRALALWLFALPLQPIVAQPAPADTAQVHDALRQRMATFFRTWRRVWTDAELRRHRPVLATDLRFGRPDDPEVRRFSLFSACPSPQGVRRLPPAGIRYRFQHTEHAVPRWITAERGDGRGAVCVDWVAVDTALPPDESEGIDLAIPHEDRTPVRRERDELLTAFSRAAAAHPADPWIAGQRVRFLVDQDRLDDALAVAESCRGDAATCHSLEGYVHHRAGRQGPAERAFRAADSLARVARAGTDACEIEELDMLHDRASEAVRDLGCATREALLARLWWLADPLWSDEGNARFAEHHARRVSVDLHAVTDEDEKYGWGRLCGYAARRRQLLRYGWPSYDYLIRPLPPTRQRAQLCPVIPFIAMEYQKDRSALVPSWRAIEQPFRATPDDWQIVKADDVTWDAWWPVEHMRLARPLATMPAGQLALFRRDTATHLALAIDGPTAHLDAGVEFAAPTVLMGGTAPDSTRLLGTGTVRPGETLRWQAALDGAPLVLSAELPSRTDREADWRLRFGLEPPAPLRRMAVGEVALSDPVFLERPLVTTDPARVYASVLASVRGSTNFRPGDTLAVYWESYGFAPGDTVDVEVRLAQRDERGVLRTVGAALGLAASLRDSVSVRWREPAPGRTSAVLGTTRPAIGRAVTLDLRGVAPGRYELLIEMRRPDGRSARGARRLDVVGE